MEVQNLDFNSLEALKSSFRIGNKSRFDILVSRYFRFRESNFEIRKFHSILRLLGINFLNAFNIMKKVGIFGTGPIAGIHAAAI